MNNSKETSIEFTPTNYPLENKMSINISSRNSGNAGKSSDNAHSTIIDGTISKLHITTTGPFIAKSLSPATAAKTNSSNNNNSYFMRGSFKSNSINYGNLMRKGVIGSGAGGGVLEQPIINTKIIQHGSTINTKRITNRVQRLNNATASTNTTQRNFNPVSPSFNSDSSSSSHTGGVEYEESEVDTISSINNNNCTAISTTTNNNGATRSRITFISDNIQTNGFNNKDNISIQISNALNNNSMGGKESTGTTCSSSNNIANDNNPSTTTPNSSNSIWYEYGCV